jgi:NAD(P)-dependent dehydrogenase (short-subunit alcohol dehydrogenase family)
MTLQGSTALVTGAGSGIGKTIALELGRSGCRVAVNDISPDAAQSSLSELAAAGIDAFSVPADVGVCSEVEAMFERVLQHYDRLDILVNNAGVQKWTPLLDQTEAEWDRVIDTNLKGCFLCTQQAGRHMRQRGSGVIVNLGSGSNKAPFPNLSSYTASKGGIEMFTRAAAVELGPYGIRVNCVAPGAIDIDRTRMEAPDFAAAWAAITPLRRIGTPEDVARVIVFLASEQASFVTGQTIWVDGAVFTQPAWPHENYGL